jgi:hypothetical protein
VKDRLLKKMRHQGLIADVYSIQIDDSETSSDNDVIGEELFHHYESIL